MKPEPKPLLQRLDDQHFLLATATQRKVTLYSEAAARIRELEELLAATHGRNDQGEQR